MKFNSLAPAVILALAGAAAAEEAAAPPAFVAFDQSKLSGEGAYFLDQFDYESTDELAKVWKVSHATKDAEFAYVGKFAVEEASVYPGFQNDKGLVLKTPAAHHAISHKLETPFDNTDDTLVLQYEVKLQNGLVCGGAYLKLLSAEGFHGDDADEFDGETPYQVMFGPDKCGATNKVHLIIKRRNPISGEMEEKHLATPPLAKIAKTSVLYTLIIKPNQDFEVRIDGAVAVAGNLLTEGALYPPLNPPETIADAEDNQPEDWDDRAEIPDPEHPEKPEDWDESIPQLIPDPSLVMPEGWLEDESYFIEDPEAQEPEDWDVEEDGVWLAPEIANPICSNVAGCGPWEPLMMTNPEYKGPWVQPMIENPDYQGQWSPQEIENPAYYEDATPSNLELIGGIGFELWTMEGDILFDNIYLGHSIADAEKLGNATFVPKLKLEKINEKANAPEAPNAAKAPPKGLFDDEEHLATEAEGDILVTAKRQVHKASKFVAEYLRDAQQFARELVEDPVEVLATRHLEALYYVTTFLGSFTLVFGLWSSLMFYLVGGPAAPAKVKGETSKKSAKSAKEERATEGTTSATAKPATTATKRKA